jgi:hypothetical protein
MRGRHGVSAAPGSASGRCQGPTRTRLNTHVPNAALPVRTPRPCSPIVSVPFASWLRRLFGLPIHTYDGDTPQAERAERRTSTRVFLTNPDMLHLAMLPHHAHEWGHVLKNLKASRQLAPSALAARPTTPPPPPLPQAPLVTPFPSSQSRFS